MKIDVNSENLDELESHERQPPKRFGITAKRWTKRSPEIAKQRVREFESHARTMKMKADRTDAKRNRKNAD